MRRRRASPSDPSSFIIQREHLDQPARANVSAGGALIERARGPLEEDRVRARNDRADRDLPRSQFAAGAPPMTAYLISLALVGLVAIAIWEGLS